MTKFEERINAIAGEALKELHKAGIFPSKNIKEIKENKRAKKRLGCCKKVMVNQSEEYSIEISTVLEQETDQMIKEIIIHELLHTCKGCFNHGKEWKRKAAEVNRMYGYKIKTYAEPKQQDIENKTEPGYKYIIECKGCGTIGYRKKKSKLIQNPQLYRCGKCGGRLCITEI